MKNKPGYDFYRKYAVMGILRCYDIPVFHELELAKKKKYISRATYFRIKADLKNICKNVYRKTNSKN